MFQFTDFEATSEVVTGATRFVELPGGFALKRGGRLFNARVGYETWGRLSSRRDNAVLILGGLSASAHVASNAYDPSPGWWERMVGSGQPIDTDRWFVICISPLGGCFGSTGPASLDPATERPYRLDFPEISIEDTAEAAAAVVRSLGIEQLACVVGTSMGGMSSLALLAERSDLARSHINVSGAIHATTFAIALRSLQRKAITNDPEWHGGDYEPGAGPRKGMRLARMLGTLTYRSAEEWQQRFARRPIDVLRANGGEVHAFAAEFEIEGYLHQQAERFVGLYDPNCYLYLSRAIDRFDLADATDGNLMLALSRIMVERALVIGVETDLLFPLRQQEAVAQGLRCRSIPAQLCRLCSIQGHDAFLVDVGRFGPPIERFLSTL